MDKVDFESKPAQMQALPIISKNSAKINKSEEKYLREIRPFEFLNSEEPGVFHKFSYGNRKRRMNFTFFHGQTYKVPRFVAKHLEENCQTPIYDWRPDGLGKMIPTLVGYKPRFQMREKIEFIQQSAKEEKMAA